MLFKLFVILLLGYQALLSQEATVPHSGERDGQTAFQTTVKSGLRPEDAYSASVFVLAHEDIAIPILLQVIKDNLDNKDAQGVVSRAAALIAYAASARGIDALSDLCSIDNERFMPMVERLLNHAINRKREYEVVYHALETDPNISDAIIRWLRDSLAFPQADVALAREIIRRETVGRSLTDNDAVMASLPIATRERVLLAIENVRNDERERRAKEH
jgi:hypothetical protein